MAARPRARAARARRPRRSGLRRVAARVDVHTSRPRLVEREHLLPAHVDARVLRSDAAAGAAGAADLRGHRQPDPRVQPRVARDVRFRRPRHVSLRARADRQPRRRVRRRPGLRVRAVSHSRRSRTCRCCRRRGCRSCSSDCGATSSPDARVRSPARLPRGRCRTSPPAITSISSARRSSSTSPGS